VPQRVNELFGISHRRPCVVARDREIVNGPPRTVSTLTGRVREKTGDVNPSQKPDRLMRHPVSKHRRGCRSELTNSLELPALDEVDLQLFTRLLLKVKEGR